MGKLEQFSRHPSSARGFTLIELLTVIAILAVLATIAAGFAQGAQEFARVARCRAELAHLAQGLEEFKRQFGDYPPGDPATSPDTLFFALTGYPGRNGQERRRPLVDPSKLTIAPSANATNAQSLGNPDPAFVDPWGNRYLYYHQASSDYVLLSAGPDGSSSRPDTSGRFAGGRRAAAVDADNLFADEPP